MLNVCGYKIHLGKVVSWVLGLGTTLFLVGCGPNKDKIEVVVNNPYIPDTYIHHMDTQGGSTASATSANRVMSIQSFGGTSLRTFSTSTNFELTSGIGVD